MQDAILHPLHTPGHLVPAWWELPAQLWVLPSLQWLCPSSQSSQLEAANCKDTTQAFCLRTVGASSPVCFPGLSKTLLPASHATGTKALGMCPYLLSISTSSMAKGDSSSHLSRSTGLPKASSHKLSPPSLHSTISLFLFSSLHFHITYPTWRKTRTKKEALAGRVP